MQVSVTGWGWRHAGRRAWAVRELDLEVAPGEKVLLVGPSGAGKSTLLLALAGLLDPSSAEETEGRITLDGVDAREARGRAGLVQQDPATSLVMARAGDDVAFGPECWGVEPAEIWPRVDEALDDVGFTLGRSRATAGLSGGEAQRLALAGVVALRPELLLLDEPTASLDPAGVLVARAAVGRVLERTGAGLVMVEHRPGPWLDLVDRVVALDASGVVADGPPAAVLSGERGRWLAEHRVWVPGFEPSWPWHAPAAGEALLQAESVTHRHRGASRPSPEDVSLVLHRGEAVAVTGRNGVGKTTFAQALGGLLRPSAGSVRATPALSADRRPLCTWRASALAGAVGSVFQRPEQQFVTGRVVDEVALGVRLAGGAPSTATDLLERLGLARLAAADPHTLSGGEQRRLSVAAVLAAAPQVLVLDEPSFGQDARTWAELVRLLQALLEEGRSVAAVTHDRPLVGALAARELVLG
ncbi:energy-coupling factor transport system ATP-binding protein [Motilibacter peucedani]|uniref:Energy-coupling factor transport system ATP-binding protein n=1 Tax=Motilibacter peucedani TaxID=598650 RepID=A0A420XME6_9ACTN|nr:ATP-binding cassette domain-containing protein [Motilibacter peucedani]RKS72473.1 energy-coupling factor transport system ATP-binding protein [Motilibacter peucedani]